MNQSFVNEASNKDTIDVLFKLASGAIDTATGASGSKNKDSYSYSSIAKAASNLVAVFPVLASRTVSPDTARMVSKYIEQQACHLFMLALQQANVDSAKSGIEYLKKYHQNINFSGSGVGEVIGTMQSWINSMAESSGINENSVSAGMINSSIDNDTDYSSLFEADDVKISATEMRDFMNYFQEMGNIKFYDTNLNPLCINDYIVNEFADGTYHVSVKPLESVTEASRSGGLRKPYRTPDNTPYMDGYKNATILNTQRNADVIRQADDEADEEYEYKKKKRTQEDEDRARKKEEQDRSDREYYQRQHDRKQQKKEHNEDRKQQKAEHREDRKRQAEMNRRVDEKYRRDERDYKNERDARRSSGANISILKDQDIKKMNDALPSLLVVTFYQKNDAGDSLSAATKFIVGVKSKLVPITSTEILRRIMNDNKDGKKFLNFMRVITGELKASEILFGLSRVKADVNSCKVKGAYGDLWNLLANRADAARAQVKAGQRNDYSAITTVVISQFDVDELYHEENIDISDPKNALHFMQSYNLMGFVIVDDSIESIKILLDNDSNMFDEYSYRMLSRELDNETYKKAISVMAAGK